MFAVDVVNLDKRFHHRRHGRRGERLALTDVSFTIARGECVAILGQNGSGKSTLVRILSTLLLPDGGSARVFGHDVVRDANAVRPLVNRVSVEASFFKRMSASENLAYAARFYGFTPAATRERIPEILERVGFSLARTGDPMQDLSRGMQQKVALARALLTSPVLLLLDEPTTGLDPRSKREVQEFIREVARDPRHDDPAVYARPGGGRDARRACRDSARGQAARARADGQPDRSLPRFDARGRVLHRDRDRIRRRRRRGGNA